MSLFDDQTGFDHCNRIPAVTDASSSATEILLRRIHLHKAHHLHLQQHNAGLPDTEARRIHDLFQRQRSLCQQVQNFPVGLRAFTQRRRVTAAGKQIGMQAAA